MSEPKPSGTEDWQALDRILNQQSEISRQIRQVIEPFHKKDISISEPAAADRAKQVANMLLEMEVLQAEERALLNRLFPKAEFWLE